MARAVDLMLLLVLAAAAVPPSLGDGEEDLVNVARHLKKTGYGYMVDYLVGLGEA